MSEQGWVTAVIQRDLGSRLYADAAAGAAELVIDYAGDFDDEGTLSLNGTQLAYVEVVSGEGEDDPDTLTLAAPLAVAATEGDLVSVVLAGQVATEMVARVSLGDGDAAEIEIPFEQRIFWPVGDYEPVVPVEVSDDLMKIETVPNREPVAKGAALGIRFLNTDTFTATAGEDLLCPLTYQPIDGSEHVVAAGVPQIAGVDWTRARRSLVVTDAGWADNRTVAVSYAYDIADQPPTASPTITSPRDGATVTDTTPIISGTGEPGYTITVDLDAAEIGITTVAADGTWSVQVAAVLNDGDHTATATQTGPDAYTETVSVTFHTQAPVFVPTVRGTTTLGGSGLFPSIAMPAGTQAGDFFVLTLNAFDGAASASDPRIDGGQANIPAGDTSRKCAVYWGTADGSGAPLPITLSGSGGRQNAALVVYAGGGVVATQQVVGPNSGAAPAVGGADAAVAGMLGVGGLIGDSGGTYTRDAAGSDGLYYCAIFHHAGDAAATTFTNTYAGMVLGVNGV